MTCYAGWDVVEVEACIHNAGERSLRGRCGLVPHSGGCGCRWLGKACQGGFPCRGDRWGFPIYYAGSTARSRMSVQVPEQPGRYRVRFKEAEDYLPRSVSLLRRSPAPSGRTPVPVDISPEFVDRARDCAGFRCPCGTECRMQAHPVGRREGMELGHGAVCIRLARGR